MPAADGKNRLTDVATPEHLFRIGASVVSPLNASDKSALEIDNANALPLNDK